MILFEPSLVSRIDSFASATLDIHVRTLMYRAAEAVARVVYSLVAKGSSVRIFAGKGNNGGDGYATACLIMNDYDVKVYDVFGAGQRSEEGKYYLNTYLSLGGIIEPMDLDQKVNVSFSTK